MTAKLKNESYGYLIAVIFILTATVVFLPGRDYFAKGQWALLYLLVIGTVARVSGTKPAILASLLAFLAWNYFFLPPFHVFAIDDYKDWLALLVFLAVGIIIGVQTGELKKREEQAKAREQESVVLSRFSAFLVTEISVAEMAENLFEQLQKYINTECLALFLPDKDKLTVAEKTNMSDSNFEPSIAETALWVYRQSKAVGLPEFRDNVFDKEGWPISVSHQDTGIQGNKYGIYLPLQTNTCQTGVLYVGQRANSGSYNLHDIRLLIGVASQTAAFLERKRLQDMSVKADALREADRMKSIFISSVSHELKTPLASMTATVTNLLSSDVIWDRVKLLSELESLKQDLERLNGSIGSLVDLTLLESSSWRPKMDFYELGDILSVVLAKFPDQQRNRINIFLPDNLPLIRADFQQYARALQNILENALSYSDSEVSIKVFSSNREIKLWIEDQGSGIPPDERSRIFEKFYRGSNSAKVSSGTGLGLAITQEIMKVHGGRIWVEDVEPHGARFVITVPQGETK